MSRFHPPFSDNLPHLAGATAAAITAWRQREALSAEQIDLVVRANAESRLDHLLRAYCTPEAGHGR